MSEERQSPGSYFPDFLYRLPGSGTTLQYLNGLGALTTFPLIPTGVNTLVASATVGETGLVILALGVRPVSVTVAGVVVGGNYMVFATGVPPAGFSLQDCSCSVNGTLIVRVLVPILTGSYSIPVRVVKIGT